VDHQPADRGRTYRHDPLHEAWRQGVDHDLPEKWVAVVKPGRVMFEIAGVSEEVAKEAMRLAAQKLPISCKFVTRAESGGEA
jgi:large subunit ribosomal protein L16